jgi:hypothetical protein
MLNNQLNPLLSHDNDDDEEMGSGVIMAEDGDDIEIDGPEDIPLEEEEEGEELEPTSEEDEELEPTSEEDEELEPASDEDGGEIFDTDSEDDA